MSQPFLMKNWVVGPFQCNCRLIVCPNTGEAALVDPGDEAPMILKNLKNVSLPNGRPIQLKLLLHTHGHLDHIAATRSIKETLAKETQGAPKIAIHKEDEPLYQALKMQGQMFQLKYDDPLPVDRYLEHEERIQIGDLKINVIHTPGHSPGSVSFRLHEDSKLGVSETVLTGDTLFQNSVGRTDLWGADQDTMFRSIKERLLSLDGDTIVCPGHGPDSRIGIEKNENPFLR
jgi:hydroxyacylglutathione hydrolase